MDKAVGSVLENELFTIAIFRENGKCSTISQMSAGFCNTSL